MKLAAAEASMTGERRRPDLFRQGMRAVKTREKYARALRKMVCEIMEDVLQGDFEERLAVMVGRGREHPDAQDAAEDLREDARRDRAAQGHAEYLNPASVPNYFKPLKKLYDVCDVSIPWKRVYATYPELDNVAESRGRTMEMATMLRRTRGPMDRALVLVLSSSGVRAGGLDLA